MHHPSLVDLTTINAIESLFRSTEPDPWGRKLAGELADLVAYSDLVRYALPLPRADMSDKDAQLPMLLRELLGGEPAVFSPARLITSESGSFNEEFLLPALRPFLAWSRLNGSTLRRWIRLHNESWIRSPHAARLPRRFSFPVAAVRELPEVLESAKSVDTELEDFLYAFDVILRYPLYGELAGPNRKYLNHPIRDAFPLPTMDRRTVPAPSVAVSFKSAISKFAHTLSMQDYVRLLLDLRYEVQRLGLNQVNPGNVEIQHVRDIAVRFKFPPTLKVTGKWLAVVGGVAGGLGAIPVLGTGAAIAGMLIAVSGALWSGQLPRAAAGLSWFSWAYEWPELEREADTRH